MKWKPYPSYKPSGVEWLGNVPAHWDVGRLKFVASVNDEVLPETTEPDLEVLYVDISSVDPIEGIRTFEAIPFDQAPSRARRVVRDGDTIVSTVRPYLRAIAPIRSPAPNLIVSTGFAVIRPRTLHSGYLAQAMRESGFAGSLVARAVGVGYPAVNSSEVADTPVPWPPFEEQTQIAAFLDAKTVRLDALVAKKRALAERLREKRTALISRTVTRGLPPEAARAAGLAPHPKLQPSGIPWLGEIPEHWDVVQLRRLALFQRGFDLPEEQREDGPVPVVSSSGVCSLHARPAARGPGIVTGRYGTIGEFHLVTTDYWPLNTSLFTLRLAGDPGFVRWMLTNLAPLFLLHAVKSAVPGVDRNDIHAIHTARPPLPEQQAIAEYLDRETARIDRLVEKVEAAIERLQEYRQALITAAVTGKIDVREKAPGPAAA